MTEFSPGPRVSVVVPVKNEALNILPLVEEIERACAPLGPFEVVYVDDGSTDATVEQVLSARATRPWLRLVRHEASCGQSAAVRTGVHAARGPIVVTLDGDGQNDPAFIPQLVAALDDPSVGSGGRTAGRPQGRRLQEVAVPHRQRGAGADPEGRDAGYGLRPEGVPPRRLSPRCPISTPCTASCRPWSSARGTGSLMWTWSIGRAMPGAPIMVCSTGFGSASLILAGVWWLIRRRRRVPAAQEIV